MFGATFDTVDDIMNGQDYGSIATEQQRRPKNCASDLDLPELKRLKVQKENSIEQQQQSFENQFAGIKNQGATCYLNSLLQSLYMSPEFRQAIYDIPICNKTIDEKSGFIKNEKKFNIIIAFQKMFAEMQSLDVRAITTEELTKSFGWGENQGLQQQDIQEALRVIYDALDRALQDTIYQDKFMRNYKGMLVNHITCLKCGNAKEREEEFYDLILQVQGFESVEQSLQNLITPETLDGDNQYFCEICNCKNDALKGQKVRVFPDILQVSLNRFVFDLNTLTRVKVDSVLKYGLELNISQFLEHSEQVDPNDPNMVYELQGVLIHRGNAHGGHYHAYIRDVLGEGNWQSLMKEYLVEKEEEEKKQKEKEQKIEIEREKEKEKNKENQEDAIEQEDKNKIAEADDEDSDNSDKKNKKGKNKREISALEKQSETQQQTQQNQNKQNKKGKQKGGNQQTTHPSGKNAKQRKKEKSKQKNEEKKKQAILDIQSYDSKEFPIPYNNKELAYDWYDFNDNSVTVIPVNRLQSQFGGNAESGYILIYRRKTLEPQQSPNMPEYLKHYIENKNNLLEQERNVYKIAEQHIEIFFTDFKNLDLENYKWAPKFDYEKEGKKIKFNIKDSLSSVFQKLKEELKIEGKFTIVEIFEKYTNKLLQFPKLYTSDNQEFLQKSIEDLQMSHFSSWIILQENNEEHQKGLEIISKKVGEEANPIKLQIVVQGKKNENLIAWSNMKLKEFRQVLVEKFPEITYNEQYIKEYQGNDQVNHLNSEKSKDEKTLTELKIYENHDLILQRIEASLLENIQQDKEKQEIVEKNLKEQEKELISILVETDENHDSNRIFVQLDWTLDYLVEHIKEKLEIKKELKRRLKNLQYNQLYFEDEYSKKLQDLDDFAEGGIRLQIERGDRPLSGNIIVNFINQSNQYQKESSQDIVNENQIIKDSDKEKKQEILIDEKATAFKLKEQICERLSLKVAEHKLYKTDHLQEPYQAIRTDQENNILKSLAIKSGDLLMLRHQSQLIQSEIKQFKLFLTTTGLPDDATPIGDMSISQTATLSDLKQRLLALPEINPMNEELDPRLLRIRARKKDLFFGPILRKEDKILKKFTFSTNQIVIQILNEPEELTDNQINLILRKRDVQNRVYIEDEEFIFDAGAAPTMNQLFDQVIAHLNKKKQNKTNGNNNNGTIEEEFEQLNLQDIRLVKYFPHEYTYTEICQETVDEFTKNTKRKGKKSQNQEINIKKAPFLIKDDGDIIGYILEKENHENTDDFQTDQDNFMLLQAKERKRMNKIQQEALAYSRGGGKKEVGVTIQSFDEEEEIALAIKQVEEFEKQQKELEQQQ